MSSAYPDIAVSGVFSSCDTFAVKSCLLLAAARIFSCCTLIFSAKGAISLYTGLSCTESIFLAILSIGSISVLVSKCDITIHTAIIAARIPNTAGNTFPNTLSILLASQDTLITVPSFCFKA